MNDEVKEVRGLFFKEKETKGTWKFQELENPETGEVISGALYVKKPALAKLGRPEQIEVIIRPVKK